MLRVELRGQDDGRRHTYATFARRLNKLYPSDAASVDIETPLDDRMRSQVVYARRLNKLYPSDAASVGIETSVGEALRKGLDAVRKRRTEECNCLVVGAEVAWCVATTRNKHDCQRAILLLEADNNRCFRLLENGPVTDENVARVMKEIPYFSPKRGRPIHLNCRARFTDSDAPIACRHLVEHRQLAQEQSAGLKFDYADFASKEAIEARVSCETEESHRKNLARALETHLFYNRDFGKLLVRQLSSMEAAGEPVRLIGLESTNHSMGVDLIIKQKDEKPRYVVRFYDPNATTSHVRAASDSLSAFELLSLKGFIVDEDWYRSYYPEDDEVSWASVRPKVQGEPAVLDPGASAAENRTLTSSIEDENVNATMLWHMLEKGFAGDLRRLKLAIAQLPNKKVKELLAAKNADGNPGLYMALQSGHADAVRAFGELLILVPEESRGALLAAKRASETPGLFMALQKGHADAIRAFGELLTLVPEESRGALLAAKRADETPGLFMALQNGHADAVRAFGEGLKWVSPESRDELVAAKDVNGMAGVFMALRAGHSGATIEAFCQLLTLVPEKSRAALFDEPPGLLTAMLKGHADTRNALFEILGRKP